MNNHRFEMRIDDKTKKQIEELAKAQKTSAAEQIRRAVNQRWNYFEKKGSIAGSPEQTYSKTFRRKTEDEEEASEEEMNTLLEQLYGKH